MPAANPPRWITIRKVPYDYRFPASGAIMAFTDAGEYLVKAEVADHAVAKGYASEGKADGSDAKAPKGKRSKKATKPGKSVKPAADAATNIPANPGLGGGDLAADDSAGAGGAVAPAAE